MDASTGGATAITATPTAADVTVAAAVI